MKPEEIKEKIQNLSVWKRGGERAPHKPLLLLLFLGRLSRNEPRLGFYKEIRGELKKLLVDFGPPRSRQATNYPFVRLVNDNIWEISGKRKLETRKDWGELELISNETTGGFKKEVFQLLKVDPKLVFELAQILLFDNFPETMHDEILEAVGLDISSEFDLVKKKKVRDPRFRDLILKAYEYRCAVCEFNVRLGHSLIGVEAAHIKWHQAGGPDHVNNGVALCTMHHKLFDRGVFTINGSFIFQVAENAHGTNGFEEWLLRYHGMEIRHPLNSEYKPYYEYIKWHEKEVFKGPPREYFF